MTSPLDRQQALLKLEQFHSKLSQHLEQLSYKKQSKPKSDNYVIYQPKHIDSSTQTIFDKSLAQTVFKSKKVEESPQKQAKRIQELKEIVEANFKKYLRVSKEKEIILQNDLNEMKHINEELEKNCAKKDAEISKLRQQLSLNSQSSSQPLDKLNKQKLKLQKQHETDISTIENLQKGIEEFQSEVKRLSDLINEKDTQILGQIRKIKELQNLYKNSQHLVDVMSKEQTVLSTKIANIEKQLKDKNSYIEYVQNLYLATEKNNINLEKQVQYFSLQNQVLEKKLKNLEQDYKTQDRIIQLFQIVNTKASQFMKQSEQHTENIDCLIQRLYQNYLEQQIHYKICAESQQKIFEESINLEKSLLEGKIEFERYEKDLLQHQLSVFQIKHQNFVEFLFSPNLDDEYQCLSESSSSFESVQHQSLSKQHQIFPEQKNLSLNVPPEQIQQILEQTPHIAINQHQLIHKQNQLHKLDAERIVSEFLQEEEQIISSLKNTSSVPSKNLDRPPSFGKENELMMPLESENSTPNFTEISVSQSIINSDIAQTLDTKLNPTCNFVETLQRTETLETTPTSEIPNFKITKSQKVSELIIPKHQKFSEEKIACQNIPIEASINQQEKNQIIEIDSKNLPQCKEAYCQATKEENLADHSDKQREGNTFIKKHESMTNWNGPQQMSPTYQKQQSDCHLMIERKKNAKKKLEYKLPPLERSKTVVHEVQKQGGHNIQTQHVSCRRLDKEKYHNKWIICSKLTDRLFELVHRQSSLQLKLSTLEQQHNYQSLGSLSSSNPRETDNQNNRMVMLEELEVMGEVERIIQDAYQLVVLVERHHKREFQKNERVTGRVKLRKIKTGINHHNIKTKESNEDCYETNRFFQCEIEKSVYSEGDSPPGVGEIDHFDISPFDHIDVQQKHEDNHSLQKLFKEGQQISQISSVKNQSQVSEFINSRSEFVKMFDAHHFAKVEEEEMHPSIASAYQEAMQLNSPNHFFHGVTGLTFNSLALKNSPHFTHHEHGQHDSTTHHHVKFEDNSIKSLRNICTKEKEKTKLLERKIVEITTMYKKFIEKLVEDDKRKAIKMQKDFNKALSMAINLKEPIMNSHSVSIPSNQKQNGQHSNPTTSIKLLPQIQQRPPLPPMKLTTSKLQSKSLTEITLLSQKISEKDEILEEKMQAYEKKIDELMMKVEDLKATINGKTEQIEELQKKNKVEKLETQKVEKRLQEQRKEVQLLKTQNKKIKNEFSQFMSKLVIEEKETNQLIKFSKKTSYEERIKVSKDIELQVPQILAIVQNLKQEAHSISPPSDASNDSKHESRVEESPLVREEKTETVGFGQITEQNEQGHDVDQKIQNRGIEQNHTELKLTRSLNEPIHMIQSKSQFSDHSLLSLLESKEHTIVEQTQTIQQNKVQIQALQKELNSLKQENLNLNDQIDLLNLQLEQKQGEIRQLSNSLVSIQTFDKRLKQKLIEAEDKIKMYQEKQNQHIKTPIKNSPQSNSEQFSTPISRISLSSQHENGSLPPNSRPKNRRGSLGSVEENFFDLETDNQFNNIETKPDINNNLTSTEKPTRLS